MTKSVIIGTKERKEENEGFIRDKSTFKTTDKYSKILRVFGEVDFQFLTKNIKKWVLNGK